MVLPSVRIEGTSGTATPTPSLCVYTHVCLVFRIWGIEFRALDVGFRVWDSWFRVEGVGYGVYDLR